MKPISISPAIYKTFLYRDLLPGIVLDNEYSLLFNFFSGDIVRVRNTLLSSESLFETLKNLGLLDTHQTTSKDEQLARLCLILTAYCNMRCVYCYNDAGQFKTKLPFQIAKVAIDNILQRQGIDYVLLQFYGGEPTLNPDCLCRAISYAREVSRVPVLPFIITNGTMKPPLLDFLIQNKSRFVFSCDLIRNIHDLQRPLRNGRSCFDLTIENIKRAVDRGRTVSIRSVVTTANVQHMVEMVTIAAGLGAKEIILGPCEINVGRARFCDNITRPPLDDYIHNYLLAMREAEHLGIHLVDHIHRILYAKDPRQSEILFVLPDGSITQNTTVLDPRAENAERYITGVFDLTTGKLSYNQSKREHLQNILRANYERFCLSRESCALSPICQGRYKAYEFTIEDNPQDLDTYNCAYRKQILADYVVHLWAGRQEHPSVISPTTDEDILLFSD